MNNASARALGREHQRHQKPTSTRRSLTADVASADIAEMIAEVESAITAADEAAEAEREKALDPALYPDPKAAREAIEAAEFARDRLAYEAAPPAGGAGCRILVAMAR